MAERTATAAMTAATATKATTKVTATVTTAGWRGVRAVDAGTDTDTDMEAGAGEPGPVPGGGRADSRNPIAAAPSRGDPGAAHVGRWQHRLADGRVQCDLCPRHCRLREGQRGFCFVRGCRGGRIVLDTYGRSSGFAIGPVEKKPG